MMFSLRSPNRPIGLALICLMVLTQTSCATLQMSPSSGPPGGETGSEEGGEGVTDLSSIGTVFIVGAAVLVVGYMLYKAIKNNRVEAEGEPESDSPPPTPACARLVSPDPEVPRGLKPLTPCKVPLPSS